MARKDLNVVSFAEVEIGGVTLEFPEMLSGERLGEKREPDATERAMRYQTRLGRHTLRLDTLYPLLKAVSAPDTLAELLDLSEECLKANNGLSTDGKRKQYGADAFRKMRGVA
jgi:hypothetical protein